MTLFENNHYKKTPLIDTISVKKALALFRGTKALGVRLGYNIQSAINTEPI